MIAEETRWAIFSDIGLEFDGTKVVEYSLEACLSNGDSTCVTMWEAKLKLHSFGGQPQVRQV